MNELLITNTMINKMNSILAKITYKMMFRTACLLCVVLKVDLAMADPKKSTFSSSKNAWSSKSSVKFGANTKSSTGFVLGSRFTSDNKASAFKSSNDSVSEKFGKKYNSDIDKKYAEQTSRKSYEAFRNTYSYEKPRYFPEEDLKKYRKKYNQSDAHIQNSQYPDSWQSRHRYYQSNPPIGINKGSNTFGILSGIFLYGLMNNITSAGEYAFHHQNDADYQKWRAEANQLAKSNAELKSKLDQIDAIKLAKSNTEYPNPNWLPDGVPISAVLSDKALKSFQPDLNVCVGSENGPYYKVAQTVMLPVLTEWVNLIPVITKGTPDILNKIDSGKCDAGFVQGDTSINEDKLNIVFRPFFEAGHLACSIKVKGKALGDLSGQTVWIPKESGSRMTWDNLVALNTIYSQITIKDAVNYEDAILQALQTQSCLFYMAAPHASSIDRLIDRTELKLITINDEQINKTEKYQSRTLSSSDYSKTIKKNLLSEGEIQTVAAPAIFVINQSWKSAHPELAAKIALKLFDIENQLKESVNQ